MQQQEKYSSGECTICAGYFTMLVWHHTVPQAHGGVDSLQIPLCASCHTILHAQADAIVAKIKSGKPISRKFWPNDDDARRAQPYVKIIVDSTLHQGELLDKEYKLNVVVSAEVHNALKCLKQDIQGISNLHDTVLYCVHHTLKSRGLLNDTNTNHNQKHPKESTKKPNCSRSDLW